VKLAAVDVRCRHCGAAPDRDCRTPRGNPVPTHETRKTTARELQAEVDAWNSAHPVGTLVRAYPGLRPDDPLAARFAPVTEVIGRTRTQAWVPKGQEQPVVMIHSYGAWIALTHVDVI